MLMTKRRQNDSNPFAELDRIEVVGARNTRKSLYTPFLQPLLDDLPRLSPAEKNLRFVQAVNGIIALDVFHPEMTKILNPTESGHLRTIRIILRELPRFRANLTTDVGNSEGSVHGSLLWRNIFGGGESLMLDYLAGTRTRNSYSGRLITPVPLVVPTARIEIQGATATEAKSWASCDEVSRGIGVHLVWGGVTPTDLSLRGMVDRTAIHRLSGGGVWRQITGLARDSSRGIKLEAGDSVKNAVRYMFQRDSRDHPRLPTSGSIIKAAIEVAGLGPLAGDVGFAKGDLEIGGAVPLSLPGFQVTDSSASITAGLKMGILCPLPVGFSTRFLPSRFPDRFYLGGPSNVRGFQVGGIGPHDGKDSLGGDLLTAVNVNFLLPIPGYGPDSALRFQVFANSGRLVALQGPVAEDGAINVRQVGSSLVRGFLDLMGGPPSVTTGIGLVYGHQAARFELNFSLPLLTRRGERPTKGFHVGFGIDFL